jgi:splicing factor U2AF 35 kDa subunit
MPNLYINPSLNAPLGPDGLPIVVDPSFVQEDYEVLPPEFDCRPCTC